MLPGIKSAALLLPILLAPIPAVAQQAGTRISIRLKSAVSTRSSNPADPVEAVVIAPVEANGRTLIPAGALVHGTVEKVAQPSAAGGRAMLLLRFTGLEAGGSRLAIAGRIESVDNARETVDDQGQIDGILASETVGGRMDAGLDELGREYSGLAGILSAAKDALFQPPSTDISYPPGVEMTLRLTEPPALPLGKAPAPAPGVPPLAGQAALLRLVRREPFRTVAQRPPNPSDITNLMLAGTEKALRRAFSEAGWSLAARLNPLSQFDTLRALAEDRGYSEAPVSVLFLDGKPPDIVFEKTNNTFARRHHLRIWRRRGHLLGQPVWAVAATHDTGIDFPEAGRSFIHRIDSQIDREREKVVNDLLFTGRVRACSLVERPAVPRQGRNASGDRFETDGRLAVLFVD